MEIQTAALDREKRAGQSSPSILVPVLLVAGGVYLRLLFSAETYLNPDEAYHFFLANRSSLSMAYHASLGSAHPPLLIVLLYYVREISTSEFVLRLPSVVAGGLFCWGVYKWLGLIGNRT